MANEKIQSCQLSAQQIRLCEQQGKDGAIYVAWCLVELQGAVDPERLLAALDKAAQRHSILHTVFARVAGDGPVLQVIQDVITIDWEQLAWRDIDEALQESKLLAVRAELHRAGFDLEHGPTVRARLVRLAEKRFNFLLMVPSLCSDAVSLQKLVQEVSGDYAGIRNHTAQVAQYTEYTQWQHNLRGEEGATLGDDYWRRIRSRSGQSEEKRLSFETRSEGNRNWLRKTANTTTGTARALNEFCERRNSSLEAFLLACWQVMLWKVNDRNRVGVHWWCRRDEQDGAEEIRGLFGRHLPVPNRLAAGTRLEDVVEEVDQYIQAAREWQEYWPGETEEQSSIQFEYREGIPAWDAGGIRFAINEIDAEIESCPFKMCCVAGKDGIRTDLCYDGSCCEDADMEHLLKQWQQLLESAASGNDKIERLEISSASERSQILVEFNKTSCECPEKCLHELIQDQVDRTPHALALIFEDHELSYHELNQRANQLAHYLRKAAIGPETLVGIFLERSIEMVVALVAVLKAGGAYVPLDPQYPQERLRYMLESSQARVLITISRLAARLSDINILDSSNPVRLLCLDLEHDVIATQSTTNPDVITQPENLAYVIYTSGSTGRPKGAMNTHKGIVNRLQWMQRTFGLDASDRVLQKTPFSFDVSVWEFFWPLLSGAVLVMAVPGGHQDAGYIVDTIQRKLITTLHFVPSMLQVFVEEIHVSECTSLRRVMASGEALPWILQQSFFEHLPVDLHNLYGPTEAAVDVTWWPCRSNSHKRVVPIGQPVGNTQIYVLDEEYQPAPLGVSGELYIGGVQVGRGYFNRAELTAERFVPNLYGGIPGDRLYRTGDRAKWTNDGQVEFLGRVDDQVKIRGFRIELGEIEAVLRQSPDVRDAAVVKKERQTGDCLIAYLVPRDRTTFDKKAIQTFVGEKLPAYMVPEVIVSLEQMPYTPSGKLNRRALPEPEQSSESEECPYVAPRTQLEELVAGIWAEVLGQPKVSIDGNFFELGGQSIMAARIITRLRAALKIDITPQVLFEVGTVARLAALIESRAWQKEDVQELTVTRAPRNIRLPLASAQERLWFFDQLSPGNHAYNLVQAVRAVGELNLDALQKSLSELVRRHETLRTVFPAFRGEPYQQIYAPRPVRLDVIDLSSKEDQEGEIRRFVDHEELAPFNLAYGPLFRVKMCKLGPQDHVIAVSVHHIIFDAWSLGVLIHEIVLLYEAFCAMQPSPLPDLPLQYADFAYWEKQTIQGQRLEKHMEFWRKHFHPPLPVFRLKADYPHPEIQTFRGAKYDIDISPELIGALKMMSRKQGATLFMALMAAFNFLMYYYSSETDIIVGTDVANRDRVETERLVGLFANQIAIRCDLSGNPTYSQLLAQVRSTTLAAYAHQEVPLDRIVTGLRLQRSVKTVPLFQVKMELVNTPFTPLHLKGLTTRPLGFSHASAKLDMVLLLHEQPSGLKGWYEYNRDLFKPETIIQMAGRFELLLRKIVQNPQITLAEAIEEIGKYEVDPEQAQASEQPDDYKWWFSWVLQNTAANQ